MSEMVMIRGFGDCSSPNICTFQVKTEADNAINVIENFLDSQTEYRRESYDFEVRTEDDSKHLYCYMDGKKY